MYLFLLENKIFFYIFLSLLFVCVTLCVATGHQAGGHTLKGFTPRREGGGLVE